MSVYFHCTGVKLLRDAQISQRVSYGGKYDALHLESNSAHRLPFDIRIPFPCTLNELQDAHFIAHLKRHTGKMPGADGVDFEHYQLVLRPIEKLRNPDIQHKDVVIERKFYDHLPLKDGWGPERPGFKVPKNPGLPTESDPIVITSHTRDGKGFYCYEIYTV